MVRIQVYEQNKTCMKEKFEGVNEKKTNNCIWFWI